MLKIIFIELLSYLSPLLFIAVLELISRKIGTKRHIRKLLYADDLAVVVDGEADLQEQLIERKIVRQKWTKSKLGEGGGMRMRMWVGPNRKELDMRLERKTLKQRDSVVLSRIVVILAASYLECLSAINLCHYAVCRQQANTDRSTKQKYYSRKVNGFTLTMMR